MNSQVDGRVPVLVVGGSLVGLSTSVFLGRLGVEHLLVEKHPGTSHHPRGRGNNLRTMELFRVAGLEQRIRAAASVLADNHGILQADTLAGPEHEWLFRQIDPGGALARFSPSGWCLCSQNDLEPVLLERARELGGDLRFGTELVYFEQDGREVIATLRDRATGEQWVVRADYLVAADGPRSPVREKLGIRQTGPGDLFHNVSITFRAKGLAEVVGDRRFIVCYLTNSQGAGALLPVDNEEHWVFHAPWHPELGETLDDFTDRRCVAHIRAAAGVPDLDVEITGKAPWHAAERVAERYSVGRIFLAGDSAHEMSPTGAFGSNTGIQDAHNLAWKLAAVLRGWAGPGLLDTYGEERRAVARATSERATERSAEHQHPGYGAVPGTGRQGNVLAVALGYRYPVGAVVGADPALPAVPERFEPSGAAGTRAPHVWLRRAAGATGGGVATRAATRLSTLDLFEASPVLLSGPGPVDWHGAAGRLADRLAVPLVSYRIGDGPECELVPEPGGDWAASFGVSSGGAVLVRPDGFVAWRSAGPVADPEAELDRVLRAVLRWAQ
ncbi:FAD-dependent oxidoreductase [Kitasatospora sp. NPDC052896]|uniref:FAD-dependent oxidoreductase n=1 Tax=Kitasatospora sp. NPDC052896 TaxID=3364061 RepID=UPI0037C75E25